jgi:hypothetical protein
MVKNRNSCTQIAIVSGSVFRYMAVVCRQLLALADRGVCGYMPRYSYGPNQNIDARMGPIFCAHLLLVGPTQRSPT